MKEKSVKEKYTKWFLTCVLHIDSFAFCWPAFINSICWPLIICCSLAGIKLRLVGIQVVHKTTILEMNIHHDYSFVLCSLSIRFIRFDVCSLQEHLMLLHWSWWWTCLVVLELAAWVFQITLMVRILNWYHFHLI